MFSIERNQIILFHGTLDNSFNNTVQTQVRIFDDHIRFHNPGHLPEGITVDMLVKEHYTYHRNPKVADIFYRAGLIERYGSGVERIIAAFCDAGMPPPEFSSMPLGFILTMRKDMLDESSLREMGLNDRQVLAVKWIKEKGSITSGEYRSLTGISATMALKDLKVLINLGILERVGASRRETRYVLRRGEYGV